VGQFEVGVGVDESRQDDGLAGVVREGVGVIPDESNRLPNGRNPVAVEHDRALTNRRTIYRGDPRRPEQFRAAVGS